MQITSRSADRLFMPILDYAPSEMAGFFFARSKLAEHTPRDRPVLSGAPDNVLPAYYRNAARLF